MNLQCIECTSTVYYNNINLTFVIFLRMITVLLYLSEQLPHQNLFGEFLKTNGLSSWPSSTYCTTTVLKSAAKQ